MNWITNYVRPRINSIFSRQVLTKLQTGDPTWENEVPPQVARIIKERGLLGCHDSFRSQLRVA